MITKERIDIIGGDAGRARGRGFTLIEILIVIAIIAILASVILVGLGPTQREGRDSRRISDLAEVQNALELYYNHCGFYPGPSQSPGDSCGTFSALPLSSGSYSDMSGDIIGLTDIGVPQIPTDPTDSGSLMYQYESGDNGNGYTLTAQLEDTGNSVLKSDETTDPIGGTTDCGQGGLYCISL